MIVDMAQMRQLFTVENALDSDLPMLLETDSSSITDCGIAFDLLCPLDCDFPLGIRLPYNMYDRLSLLQCHHTNL